MDNYWKELVGKYEKAYREGDIMFFLYPPYSLTKDLLEETREDKEKDWQGHDVQWYP